MMSYQGSAWGTLTVHCHNNDPKEVKSFVCSHEKMHLWLDREARIVGRQIKLDIDCEISYYFSDYVSDVAKDLRERFPGAYIEGALYMRSEGDVPYRWEIYQDGTIHVSADLDWLLKYSCEDINKLQKYAEDHFVLDPIGGGLMAKYCVSVNVVYTLDVEVEAGSVSQAIRYAKEDVDLAKINTNEPEDVVAALVENLETKKVTISDEYS